MKKILTSSLLFIVLAVTVQADAVSAQYVPPYDPPLEMDITIKWGNVGGTPHNTNRVSFDGNISVSDGDVSLLEVLKFEPHDDEKDEITRKENPVAWTSWIFNKWDGVKVRVVADPRESITVDTDSGSITVPIASLLTSKQVTALRFGDGREITIKMNKVNTDPFYIYALWGGPVSSVTDEVAMQTEIAEFADKLREVSSPEALTAVLDSRPSLVPAGEDFSGALSINNGARGKLIESILFEPNQGDKITTSRPNYVAWDSLISGHYDGLFLKAQLDQRYPIDDTIGIKFSELEFRKEYSLASLYVYGLAYDRIVVGDKTYLVAFITVKAPFCDRGIHPSPSAVCDTDAITPEPAPTPVEVKPLPISIRSLLQSADTLLSKVKTLDVITR